VVKNNLEAVKEVVRQLRLRDIGGIIVIDFIDMANPKNRQAVEDALRQELERDRTKTYVVEISPLGLVEMTRQNVTDGPREVMTRKCPTCGGDGIVVSDATIALDVERKLRALAASGAGSRVQAYRVALHPRTLALVAGSGGERLATLEDVTRRRFYLVPAEGHAHADHFEVVAEGRRDDLAPTAPVEEGAQVDVKLVEVDLYDATAAVGRFDGFPVVVADAANRIGKKATVAIGRVLEGQAFATPVGGETPADPITFESEAEKPTRAPSRRRPADAKAAPAVEVPVEDAEPSPAEEAEPVTEGAEVAEAGEQGEASAPAKKRTRRGSRGGKRRRKAASTAEAVASETAEGAAEPEPSPQSGETGEAKKQAPRPRKRTPRIHVPDADGLVADAAADEAEQPSQEAEPGSRNGAGDDVVLLVAESPPTDGAQPEEGAPPKKRTRRGSRGGKNRRRKPATPTQDADSVSVATEEPEPQPAESEGARGDGYVPMSEWIDELES
jgi:ribonuclease G